MAVARVDAPEAVGAARTGISHLGDRRPGTYALGQEAFSYAQVSKRPAATA
jgi:hypothetical protein